MLSVVAPGAESAIVETEFVPMACDPLDSHVSRQLIKWGHYNPEEVANYKEVSNGLDSALIIGSHIGSLATQLLLELEFDEVYFPRSGLGGAPEQCLLTAL